MGISAQQMLGTDPEYLAKQLRTQQLEGSMSPYGDISTKGAGLAGGILGGGIANLFSGRGFFDISDPSLRAVSEVNSIVSEGLRNVDATDPQSMATAYASLARSLSDKGYGNVATLAMKEAGKYGEEATKRSIELAKVLNKDDRSPEKKRMDELIAQGLPPEKARAIAYKTEGTDIRRMLQEMKQAEAESRKEEAKRSAIRNGNRILGTIKEAKNLVGPLTAGFGGTLAVLPGSDARKLRNQVASIKANLGFDRLQQMREASPTGGALGQVAVQELNYLQSTIDTLDTLEDPKDLLKALNNIEKHYNNWVAALEGREPEPVTPAGAPAAKPATPSGAPGSSAQNPIKLK